MAPAGNLLIFVNPHSGTGQSIQVFEKKIAPELEKKNIKYELITTEHAGHASSIIKTRQDLKKFNAIVICSGDGLMFEILNGILQRPDKSELLKIPFGIIPTGTGNGLLASISSYRKLVKFILFYLFKILFFRLPMKDGPFHETAYTILPDLEVLAFPINLTHVETPTQQLGSFLSIGWGMMADIDTESEKWRFMGNLRLFFGAVVRLIDFRTYKGRLSYLRSEPSEAKTIEPTKVYGTSVSSSTSAKSSTVKDEEDLTEFFEAHHGSDYGKIPRLNEEIPENWETIEDEFLLVYAMSLSHISNNGDYVHQASLVDDQIYLTYILKNDVDSRINVTKFLLAVEGYFGRSGHQQFDFFRMVAVKSFRLEPIDTGSVITVDGEAIDCPKIQATATNINISVMSK